MLLKMIELGYKIDEIVFIDTGAEFPAMYEHIEKVSKMINKEITVLKFKYEFKYYMTEYEKTKGKSKGQKGYGWCGGMCRWGTQFKKQTFARYVKEKYNNSITEYQGIAADETERLTKNKEKVWEVKYPLAELNLTESRCLEYCYSRGFTWNGLYKYLDRVSCWCCRNKNLKELENIYKYMPEVWGKLKNLENQVGRYKKDYSLSDLERRFKIKENQISFLESD